VPDHARGPHGISIQGQDHQDRSDDPRGRVSNGGNGFCPPGSKRNLEFSCRAFCDVCERSVGSCSLILKRHVLNKEFLRTSYVRVTHRVTLSFLRTTPKDPCHHRSIEPGRCTLILTAQRRAAVLRASLSLRRRAPRRCVRCSGATLRAGSGRGDAVRLRRLGRRRGDTQGPFALDLKVGGGAARDALRPGENATPDLKAQHCGLDCANGTMF
jgi:hypothetical protein